MQGIHIPQKPKQDDRGPRIGVRPHAVWVEGRATSCSKGTDLKKCLPKAKAMPSASSGREMRRRSRRRLDDQRHRRPVNAVSANVAGRAAPHGPTVTSPGDYPSQQAMTSAHKIALPPDDVRLPDERARLRADEGHARVARLRGGAGARGGRPDPVQHVLDPRVGRQPLHRAPGRGQAAEARAPRAGGGGRRMLGAVGQGGGVRALPVRRRRVRPRPGAQARGVPDERLARPRRATSSSRASPAICRPGERVRSRGGCRSAWDATARAPTASSPPRADARSAVRRGSSWPRCGRWPPTACAR